ncbi:MAG: hypothetical protein M1830_004487, partial [Pleopsidium flavum]
MDGRRSSLGAPRPTLPQSAQSSSSSTIESSLSTQQTVGEMERNITPSSALLQDLLREKKAQSHHLRKVSHNHTTNKPDNGLAIDGRQVQSSPQGPLQHREITAKQRRRASGIGALDGAVPKEMGAREMNEYISKINKQNFDLKLELFHRRERAATLERKLDKMQNLESENEELHKINGQLLQELEKRDQAVGEAVGMIVQLENKVERLEIALIDTRPSTAQPDSDYLSTEGEGIEPASSPPQISQVTPRTPDRKVSPPKLQSRPSLAPGVSSKLMTLGISQTSRTPIRTPLCLSNKCSSASALRSLYLAEDNQSNVSFSAISVSRLGSVLSKDEDTQGPNWDTYTLNSPRLSVLSESSFLSVYGSPKGLKSENMKDELNELKPTEEVSNESDSRRSLKKQQQHARVDQWIQERDTPPKANRPARPQASLDGEYSSIGEVLQTRPHLTDEDIWGASPQKGYAEYPSRKKHQGQVKTFDSPSFGGPIFGTQVLPPTPDILIGDNQNACNPSTPRAIIEKSLLDGTPAPAKKYAALVPRHRPHTADGVDTGRNTEPSGTFDT